MATTTTKKINVTGVQAGRGPNNSTPVRMELRTFLADADRRNLYLLGLEHMQARPLADMKSWFQICGIHGLPYKPWDGEVGPDGTKSSGYCTHSSVLFLPWHRPYCAIFEQALHENIRLVVETFPPGPTRDRLAKVATTFRIPYWDWALNESPHQILAQKTVEVTKPAGKVQIPNPLYSYRFSNLDVFKGQGLGPEFETWLQTVRYPTSLNDPHAESSAEFVTVVQASFNRLQQSQAGHWLNLQERVWHLLNIEQNQYPTFISFSNNKWRENGTSSDYDSLETIHDSIHGIVAGGGHMGFPDTAGFDPIFWLHHCNVDRVYALWQALHPDADLNWNFGVAEAGSGQWWVPDDKELPDTALIPFHHTDTQYWDSNRARDFKVMGYTYPELTDWNVPGVSRAQLRSQVSARVRSLYGNKTLAGQLLRVRRSPQAAPTPQAAFTTQAAPTPQAAFTSQAVPTPQAAPTPQAVPGPKAAPSPQPKHVSAKPRTGSSTPFARLAQLAHGLGGGADDANADDAETGDDDDIVLQPTDKIGSVPVSKLIKDGSHREYFFNVRALKYAFHGTFVVHVFLGEFSTDPKQRPLDGNLVGSAHFFVNNADNTQCGNCKTGAENKLMVTGAVPLTSALLERIDRVGSLDVEDVEPYLKQNLHWRIHRSTEAHENIDRHTVEEELRVFVTSAIVDHPTAQDRNELPVYRDWNPIPGITAGRPTGCGFDDAEGYEA